MTNPSHTNFQMGLVCFPTLWECKRSEVMGGKKGCAFCAFSLQGLLWLRVSVENRAVLCLCQEQDKAWPSWVTAPLGA